MSTRTLPRPASIWFEDHSLRLQTIKGISGNRPKTPVLDSVRAMERRRDAVRDAIGHRNRKNGTVGQRHKCLAALSADRPPFPGVGFESTEFVSTARSVFFAKYECSFVFTSASGSARNRSIHPCCNRFLWTRPRCPYLSRDPSRKVIREVADVAE